MTLLELGSPFSFDTVDYKKNQKVKEMLLTIPADFSEPPCDHPLTPGPDRLGDEGLKRWHRLPLTTLLHQKWEQGGTGSTSGATAQRIQHHPLPHGPDRPR